MEKLKIGIIGVGRIGKRHAEHISNLAELTAVCDIKEFEMKSVSNKYKCNTFTSIDEFLLKEKDIELVAVCSPNGLHKEHTIKCLKAGKHVLCEKPMATSSNDAEEMIMTAEKMNKRLFVVKQNRFNPPVAAVKKALEENRLGKIFSVQLNCFWNRNEDYYINSDWKGKKDLDGGTLYTQFSHFIDLLYWFFGDVIRVKAYGNNYNHLDIIEFEDSGVVILKFHNNIIGTINYTVNSYKKNMEGSITIFGEKGTVKIGGQYLNELEYQNIENFRIENLPDGNPPNNYGDYVGSMSNHDKVYANVIDVLNNHGSIMTNALEGLKTVQIIEKIYYEING